MLIFSLGSFHFVILLHVIHSVTCDYFNQQPRIISSDGHVIFQAAENRNISLKCLGSGSIRLNDDDLVTVVETAKQTAIQLTQLKQEDLATIHLRVQEAFEQLDKLDALTGRLHQLETSVATLSSLVQNSTRRIVTLNNRISLNRNQFRNLRRRLNTIQRLLNKDECTSNPCRNGGKCEDGYNSYVCRCPDYWQGVNCEEDVNECALFTGTPQGCQNGATCVNLVGSFECQCSANWHGVHCNEKHDDCTGASSQALCGHGLCHNVERVQSGMPKYECLCDEGWNKTAGPNPACVTDVDECSWARYPCSVNPKVPCYNTQGSYICGSCPSGYIGNGHTCEDVNECFVNNGGCSMYPVVQCTNTLGSRQCGPCPQGYQGDGVICSQANVCLMNNGGCSSLAVCIMNLAMVGGRECRCGPGYVGSGLGPYGCTVQAGGHTSDPGVFLNPCDSNPCVHGTCILYGVSYHCTCQPGFIGVNCENQLNPCLSHPCQSGGSCTAIGMEYSCTCASGFTGSNCQEQQQGCGGNLYEQSGNLRYPLFQGDDYLHNQDCVWLITTAWGKVLNLTFTEFHLEEGPNCEYDFVQINDGHSITSNLIGHFCGTELPKGGSIVTHSDSVHIWLHSDHSQAGKGFKLSWNTTDPQCGGHSDAAYGFIQTPGYPGKYPFNRDCYWTITVPAGKKISFQFHTLQLEEHFNCSYDFLEIRNGLSIDDQLLARYCQTYTPEPLTTPGRSVLLYFHSDDFNNDVGFHITYTSIPGICGGEITDPQGVITSPDFPNLYAAELECDWHITVLNNERIKLTFTYLDLEKHSGCTYDFVAVWDGPNSHSAFINQVCGKVIPPPVISSSNHLFIKFRTDETEHYTGFRAEYELVCGGDYSDSTGSIHSPYYPNPYPESSECIYRISQPVGTIIILEFEAFDVEGDYQDDVSCHYDFLEIYDGHNENSPFRVKLCGEKSPEPIVSTQNYLWMRFTTDSSKQNKGFLAHYRTENIQCGGIFLNIMAGIISSPEHPMPYPPDTLCTWIIQVPAHYAVSLTFTAFYLEGSGSCHYDYVDVFDNVTLLNKNGYSMGRFCGSTIPTPLVSMGDLMTIVFKSDPSDSYDGFTATFEAVDNSAVCGRNYSNQVGFLRSPNYPNGYSNYLDCTWIIKVPSMQQIEINITEIDLELHDTCAFDYIEIRNGGTATSPLLGRYCNPQNVPGLIKSHSNQLYIHFHSDESNDGKGFNFIWDGTLTGCSGVLNAASGTITSPNYPDHYDHDILCEWHIAVNHGSRIKLIINDIDLEENHDCSYDYLEIVERNTNRTSRKFCGHTIPVSPIFTDTNAAIIRFRSEGSVNGRGFSLNFETDCNINITSGRRGVIESPNFPNVYPHYQNCTWNVHAPWGNKIRLVFSHLDIERAFNCSYDSLEIRDAATEPPKVVGRYCDSHIPPDPITSESELMVINFNSDYNGAFDGFRLEWFIIGCGGNYARNEGTLSYPEDVNHLPRVICEWSITVDYGHQVKLVLDKFDLDFLNCNGNSLQIFGGPDSTSPSLTAPLCHKSSNPLIFTSMGNHMFLRYSRSVMARGSGFTASWTAIEGGCSHQFSSPNGIINSPNYPNDYNTLDDCSWLITVDEFHTIALTFQDFQLEMHTSCLYDYVAVFDGDSEEAEKIFIYCSYNEIPTRIVRSSSNNMYIRFKADGSGQHRGFKANYSMDCGGVLNANEGGIISISPSFITYSYSPNCTWLIKAENPGDHVTLAITELRILDSRRRGWNCSMGYVRVYDGDSEFAPKLGTYCRLDAPPPMTSEGNSLYVVLTKGRNHSGSNFFANSISLTANYYESSSSCGSNYTSVSGAFSSPGYPNGYPLEMECIWFITAPPGNRIQLSFSAFDIEDSENCNLDHLEIHEVNASGPLLGTFCGSDLPTNLTAAESFWIKFRSDDAGTALGFMANYKLLFGNEIIGTEGKIASPLYPHFSNINGIYKWHIIVPMEMLVQVEFEDFSYNRTIFRSMTFYDGGDVTAPVLKRLRGVSLPDPLYSSGNELVIVYPTAHFSQSRFLLSWKAIYEIPPTEVSGETFIWTQSTSDVPGCGGHLWVHSNGTTNVTSPGYPNGYSSYLNCEWILQADLGNRISLKFIDIDLVEYYHQCYYDAISIYDGENGLPNWGNEPVATVCQRDSEGTYVNSSGHFMKVQFRSNYENRTGFLAQAEIKCGGYFYTSMGSLQSTNFPSDYPTNQNCEWLISVKPGRTILIRIQVLDIEDTDGCIDDYIIFRNGATKNSPLLFDGKYCNNHRPPSTMNSTSNHVYIKFVADHKGSNRGFKLRYEEQTINCGGHIVLTSNSPQFEFTTPNFPRIPPPHSECKWIVTAPAAHRVQLDFDSTFDITDLNNCSTEFVEGYDGGTINSDLLFRKCGREAPETFWTHGNTMLIRYYTDTDNEGSGFKATAKIAVCGGTFVTKLGIINSPDYPAPFANDLNCEWKVKGPTGHYISFLPLNYELPYSENCSQTSHVSIRDYDDKELKNFCGHAVNPIAVNTSDNQGSVRFKSFTNIPQYSGFRLKFNASVDFCGGEMTTSTGIITSPNFPGMYPHKQRCFWKITVAEGRRIRLEFTDFNLEEKSMYHDDQLNCIDQVMLFDGTISYSPRLSQSLCGSTLPPVFHTSGNALGMYFFTDGDSTGSGFRLIYSSDEPAVCGGKINSFPKQLSSPTSLTAENSSVHCIWEINRPELANTSISFDISYFNVEPRYSVDFQCFQAFLKIFIGPDVDGAQLLFDLCGNLTDQHVFVVPATTIWLRYKKALSNDTTKGFNLTANIQNCGGVITDQEFTLVTPNYPNNYGPNIHCAWVITVEEEQQIKLTFDEFNLDENSKDFLIIYNGQSPAKSPKFGHFNATFKPNGIHSKGNSLWIEFHSDAAGGGRGFKATGYADSGGCGGYYNVDKGTVLSTNFPNRYPNNIECIWEVKLSHGFYGVITFVDRFDLQTDDSCSKDFVAIYEEVENEWKQIGNNLCGKQLPQPVTTKNNKFRVMFQTDGSTNGDGFKLKWDKGCGGVYNESFGKVYSPGFPQEYSTYLTCDYLIVTDREHYIQLAFDDDFDVENETSCTWDSVEIFSGRNERGTSLGKYCGTVAPGPFVVRGGAAFMRFSSDSIVVKKGFVLNYAVQECGGNLTGSSGIFQSPTHPMSYFPNTKCTWTIKGTEGLYVEVVFVKFDMEEMNCYYDYVKLYDGDSVQSPLIGTYCGTKEKPLRVLSKSDVLTVQFVSDEIIHHFGFQAYYRSTYGEKHNCGGYKNVSSGSISSLDHDNDGYYEPDLTCIWVIETPEEHKNIKMTFDKFDIEAPDDSEKGCPWDYLEIRDGASEYSRLIDRYCGTTVPSIISSSGKSVWVKFHSDSSHNKAGFHFNYISITAPCSDNLVATNHSKELVSPNYPYGYPPNIRCEWNITADRPGSIELIFVDFELENSTKCSNDFLEVRDSKDDDIYMHWGLELEGIYCGKSIPHHFLSFYPNVRLNFASDNTHSNTGFKLTYRLATCNYSYGENEDNGRIRINLKNFFATDSCIVSISTTEGKTIALYFITFEISWSQNCTDGYMKVFDGKTVSDPLLESTCGYYYPNPIFSSGNNLLLVLKPPGTYYRNVIDALFTTTDQGVGCGGTLSGINGTVTSPYYPGNYSMDKECKWIIQVPPAAAVELYMSDVDIPSSDCNVHLSIYDGREAVLNKRLAHFCEAFNYNTPRTIHSSDHEILIQYVSNVNNTRRGFRATFKYNGWKEFIPETIPKD